MSQIYTFNMVLDKVKKIHQDIRALQNKEDNSFHEQVLKEITVFLDYKSGANTQKNQIIRTQINDQGNADDSGTVSK